MSIVSFPRYEMPNNVSAGPSLDGSTNFDLNTATGWLAMVFMMPETKEIDRVYFRIVGASSASFTARVTIETVSTTTGEPTGTILVGPCDVTIVSGAADYTALFSTPATVNKGTLCCVRIGVAPGGGTPSLVSIGKFADDNVSFGLPYCLDFVTTAGFRDSIAPLIGIGSSDSTAVQIKHFWPINAAGSDTFSSSSTPDTIGNRMVLDLPARFCGVKMWHDTDVVGIGGVVKLYGTDASTVLSSIEIAGPVPPTTTAYITEHISTGSVDLTPGTYWLAYEASTTTTVALCTMTFPNDQWRYGSPLGGGSLAYATCTQTPTGVGSWTVNTSKQAFLAPIFDGFEAGGGGETSHVFIG
jgi:hypothetical protein